MIQKKLTGYRPNYPRKALRSAAMTAAALVAIGGVTGCRPPISSRLQTSGIVPMPAPTAEELVLDGEVAIPEPTEEPMLRTDGMVPLADPTEEPLVLEGEVAIPDATEEALCLAGEPNVEEPEPTLQTTGVLLMPSATPEA